jgi:hypothetical protein
MLLTPLVVIGSEDSSYITRQYRLTDSMHQHNDY